MLNDLLNNKENEKMQHLKSLTSEIGFTRDVIDILIKRYDIGNVKSKIEDISEVEIKDILDKILMEENKSKSSEEVYRKLI